MGPGSARRAGRKQRASGILGNPGRYGRRFRAGCFIVRDPASRRGMVAEGRLQLNSSWRAPAAIAWAVQIARDSANLPAGSAGTPAAAARGLLLAAAGVSEAGTVRGCSRMGTVSRNRSIAASDKLACCCSASLRTIWASQVRFCWIFVEKGPRALTSRHAASKAAVIRASCSGDATRLRNGICFLPVLPFVQGMSKLCDVFNTALAAAGMKNWA